jgi:hypothetical protein
MRPESARIHIMSSFAIAETADQLAAVLELAGELKRRADELRREAQDAGLPWMFTTVVDGMPEFADRQCFLSFKYDGELEGSILLHLALLRDAREAVKRVHRSGCNLVLEYHVRPAANSSIELGGAKSDWISELDVGVAIHFLGPPEPESRAPLDR